MPRDLIESMTVEYRRYKALGEGAFVQVTDSELSRAPSSDDNSIVMIVWHIAGNLKARFTDFLTTDGEKPWRHRDEEFTERTVSRDAMLQKWEEGWRVLFASLDELSDDSLHQVVTIRSEQLRVHQALHRSLAHTSYHVGQIVHAAKAFRGSAWRSLSIPKGASDAWTSRQQR